MTFEDLKQLYLKKKASVGQEAYKFISQILKDAKSIHKRDWKKKPTARGDHEQSWRAFKGKNMEKLILYIVEDTVEEMGLKIISGNRLERAKRISDELAEVKRKLCIDYDEYGMHLPDVDMVIYNPKTLHILCVISCKVTLRERVAQTGYWKLKLLQDASQKHIAVFFATPDEDQTFKSKSKTLIKKGRAIVEHDTDGCYVLSENEFEGSDKVKSFPNFFVDLQKLSKLHEQ
ncbi:MAG: BsaWI family type II restriction enzyme [Chloroherpetonaceae bacterium]